MAEQKKSGNKTIAENRKAFHDYFVEESFEAGIELCGTEVKALRAGGVNLKDALRGGRRSVCQRYARQPLRAGQHLQS